MYKMVDSSLDESFLHGLDMDFDVVDNEFSASAEASEDSFDISSIPYILTNELLDFPSCSDDTKVIQPFEHSLDSEGFGCTSNQMTLSDEVDDLMEWMEAGESLFLSEHSSIPEQDIGITCLSSSKNLHPVDSSTLVEPLLVLPREDLDLDDHIIIPHLLKAYGDAMENGQGELAEVIVKSITQKVNPSGASINRLAYYLFESFDKQGNYLKQEAYKNFYAIFKAFYQIFPYGRFAHFTANLAILEAVPTGTKVIHIIDFDLGNGVQWPSLFEAVGQNKSIRLTSVKWKENDYDGVDPQWRFEDVKRHLCDHAHSFGFKLEVDEMDMKEMISYVSNKNSMDGGKEWLAFNCMSSLPHMGRSRSTRNVVEFLTVANQLIIKSSKRGIVVHGDGDVTDGRKGNCSDFGSYFEHLLHFNAIFESIDWYFPSQLTDAKIAMECLFVAPNVSSSTSFQKWKESREGSGLKSVFGLEGWRFSRENILQAKEMTRDGEGLYEVKVHGENQNEMVLEWRGTPLVRVSAWR